MASPDPTCTVADGAGAAVSTLNGVNVGAGDLITVALSNSAGVNAWSLIVASTDELSTAPALTINSLAKTATFTAPAAGSAVRLSSTVIGPTAPGNATTFCIYVLTAGGKRVLAANETTEGNAAAGWIATVNPGIRTGGGAGTVPTGTGWYHVTAGAADAVSITAGDSAIVGGAFTIAALSSAAVIPVTTALSFGANPSLTGVIRLASNRAIISRNAANTADLNLASYNSSDQCLLGDAAAATVIMSSGGGTFLRGTALQIQPVGGAINAWAFTGLASGATALTVDATLAPTITQAARTSDVICNDFAIAPQAPFATATGANQVPGSFYVNVSTPVGGNVNEAGFGLKRAGTKVAVIQALVSAPGFTGIYLSTSAVTPGVGNYAVMSDGTDTLINAPSGSILFKIGNAASCYVTSAGLSINGAPSFGGGVGVMCLLNATTAPTTNPVGGTVCYADSLLSGSLKTRGLGNIVTTLAAGCATSTAAQKKHLKEELEASLALGTGVVWTCPTLTAGQSISGKIRCRVNNNAANESAWNEMAFNLMFGETTVQVVQIFTSAALSGSAVISLALSASAVASNSFTITATTGKASPTPSWTTAEYDIYSTT